MLNRYLSLIRISQQGCGVHGASPTHTYVWWGLEDFLETCTSTFSRTHIQSAVRYACVEGFCRGLWNSLCSPLLCSLCLPCTDNLEVVPVGSDHTRVIVVPFFFFFFSDDFFLLLTWAVVLHALSRTGIYSTLPITGGCRRSACLHSTAALRHCTNP